MYDPTLTKGTHGLSPFSRTGLSIFGGRHPVVELGLTHTGIQFVKNDCILAQEEKDNLTSTKGARFALITGYHSPLTL